MSHENEPMHEVPVGASSAESGEFRSGNEERVGEAEDLGTELGGSGEFESEEFVRNLWRSVRRLAPRLAPLLKRLAPIAGRVVGGALGGPPRAMGGAALGKAVSHLEADEETFDGEPGDTEEEMEAQVVPGLTPAMDVLAEALAAEAAETESEAEAQTLAGGTTIYIVAPAPLAVKKVAPVLSRGTARLTHLLRKSPRTRPLVRALPAITRNTVATLSKKVANGKPINASTAARTMAKHTVRLLKSPQETAIALVNNQVKRKKLNPKAIARAEMYAQ